MWIKKLKPILKIKKILFNSYKNKMKCAIFFIVFLSLIFTIIISNNSVNNLYNKSSNEIKNGLEASNKEYLNNYINVTSEIVGVKIQHFLDDEAILSNIYQKIMDKEDEFNPLFNNISDIDYFKDNIKFNGSWYENTSASETALLIQKYLLDNNNNIKPGVKNVSEKSAILNLFMPSFYKYGAKKLWIYYTGDKENSFMRVSPWEDIGSKMDKIYPNHSELPIWDNFSPGLVEAWEEKIKNNDKYKNDLSSLLVVKPPYEDGITGKAVMSLNFPIWNKDRNKFKGSINMDFEISEITSYVESLKLSKTGFAYITQSNGNIIAVNKSGEKTLGLKSFYDYSLGNEKNFGYNNINRFLGESTYNSVKNIKFPTDNNVHKNEIEIEGKQYVLYQKNLMNLNAWKKDKGFYNETWTLGFVVPKQELFQSYYSVTNQMSLAKNEIIGKQFAVMLFILIISGATIYIFSNAITKDLGKLGHVASEITKGNYDVDIRINSNDEVGKLAQVIKKMASEIKLTFKEIKNQNELLTKEIEEKKSKEKIINYLENYDTLTKLPKESRLINRIQESILNGTGTVMLIGVDNFRRVNEVLGHEGGNEILKMIAERIKKTCEDSDMISRVNGDEFIVFYNDDTSFDNISLKVDQIMECMKPSFIKDNKEIYITVSIGISTFPSDTINSYDLIKYASAALTRAKENGKGNYQFYDSEINKSNEKRIELIKNLTYAILNEEFELYYQPKIQMKSKKIIGVEALIRWNSEELGVVSPQDFIPLAEETGLILEIGEWVINKACAQIKDLHNLGFTDITVAVNISPLQFRQSDLLSIIRNALREERLPSNYFEIEVTEGLFIDDIKKVVEVLKKLQAIGVKTAVDDFGMGYSSLSYIKTLPIHKLKIDRNFIKDIPYNDNGALANIIIDMGRSLGLKIIAEGVETKEQEKFLMQRNCDEVQGFFYSKPLTFSQLIEKLKDFN